MTQWRVINRLRSIAEHGGMEQSKDRRATTHNVRQSWPARFWFVPYNTGWHLAHHVDMGVPWRNLPAYHAETGAGRLRDRRHHLPQLPVAVEGALERRASLASVDAERSAQHDALSRCARLEIGGRDQGRAMEGAGELVQLDRDPGLQQPQPVEDPFVAQGVVLGR